MISSLRVRNFKAVADSGAIKLTPLTVFVGHNGTGKSSLIEALELLQHYTLHGLDAALAPWYDFEHILWKGTERQRDGASPFFTHPLAIQVSGTRRSPRAGKLRWRLEWELGRLAEDAGGQPANSVASRQEFFRVFKHFECYRRFGEPATEHKENAKKAVELPGLMRAGESLFSLDGTHGMDRWLFLSLHAGAIGQPYRRTPRRGFSPLEKTGSNLAEVLESFLQADKAGFDAMLDALRYIVPYAVDVQPETIRDAVESRSIFKLTEGFGGKSSAPLPGWVLSGGTLRLLALLAALRHPSGPDVLVVDELENGLDPRAIGFVVEEIREAVENGGKQVIATTHSPYLLDKLTLGHVVTVERTPGGPPVFRRPEENAELAKWAERFAPGALYTMGLFRGGKGGAK
jgi:predicted ATPase